jgi:hypothetical protein
VAVPGTYRGSIPVSHFFDPATNLWAAFDENATFVAGWRLSPEQALYLGETGNVQ